MKPHCPAFMRVLKESPTLGIKKWPQSPCLTNRFTVLGIEGFVPRLNLALGASIWDVEGHIEFSTSCVNRSLPASCAHPPLLCSWGAFFHLATESGPQTKSRSFVRERMTFAKEAYTSAGAPRGRAKRPGGDVTLDFHKGKSGLFLGR